MENRTKKMMRYYAKCSGEGCEAKHNCYRYTVKPTPYQSYFNYPPIENNTCEYYIYTDNKD